MNKYYYKHLSQWERRKLESLICNKPILKPIFGTTDHWWNIVNWKWLIDINSLAFELKRSRESKNTNLRISKNKDFKIWKTWEFIKNELNNKQSLKAIPGKSKLAYLNGEIDQPISVMTLYSYIDNENILYINHSHLKRKRKHKYRTRNYCKRQNGISISERPEYINQNKEFGHWEMGLVIGKKSTNVNLLTLYERKSKIGMA